jgi:hypothetical protein
LKGCCAGVNLLQRGKNSGFDLLDISGFNGPNPPLGEKFVGHRLTQAVPGADIPHGPSAHKIKLNDSLLQISAAPPHKRPDLGGKTYEVPRDRGAQKRVAQERQCHMRKSLVYFAQPLHHQQVI